MTLKIYEELVQGTPEWLAARCGIVTASVMGQLITPGTVKVAKNDYSRGLTATLVAERITGHVEPMQVSQAMMRGTLDEPYARDAYAEHHAPVEELGFMVRDFGKYKLGYSPDGLVGDDGLIEIKSRAQKKHLQTILADEVPLENMAQIQTGLLVSGRDWCDYVSFCSGMPLYTKRVTQSLRWFAAITEAVETFEANAAEMLATYTAATKNLPATERLDHFAEMEIY
ncbi:lambda exonuclease family protein [Pseudarthrobacter oxydans]|uniref:lambda exonuclease family protein n=1 Tax=Pseudarthrobacter oxydans TaxID=1671 RepID=UPI00342389E0